MSETIRITHDGPVATLVLDRPPLNILDQATIAAFDDAVRALPDDDSVRVLVLRGAGERAFSAGVAIEDHRPENIGPMLDAFHGLLTRLSALDIVTVAVVHGHCLGGGMELASACDLVIASDDSRFGQPEIGLACYPPWAAALYPRSLGQAWAADLVLTGRTLDATEAERIGFLSRRVPRDRLDRATDDLLASLTRHSGVALRHAKRALRAGSNLPFAEALTECERLYRDELARSHDTAEGVRAFLDKRPPRWQHR